MKERASGLRSLRLRVEAMLRSDDFNDHLEEWERLPGRQVINPLLSFLFHPEEIVKWRAVTAIGVVMAALAGSDMEAARNVMRRLIWSLNDESGGIGWGSAEAMGEIMARHRGLACEYGCILMSYIRKDCNPLENRYLERGVLWGIGRVAQERPELVDVCSEHLLPYLASDDVIQRAMAAWTLQFLSGAVARDVLSQLLEDKSEVSLYEGGILRRCTVADLAGRLGERSAVQPVQ